MYIEKFKRTLSIRKIKLVKMLKETGRIVKIFFTKYEPIEALKKVPDNYKKMGITFGVLNLVITFISLIFAFLLKSTNLLIQTRLIILGILLFMLSKAEGLITQFIRNYLNIERENFEEVIEDEIIKIGSTILNRTEEKVFIYDKDNNLSNIMNNESLVNCIKRYLKIYWDYSISRPFHIIEAFSIFLMLVAAVITNNEVPNIIFIPLIVFFFAFEFLISSYKASNRDKCNTKRRKLDNKKSVLNNDLLRIKSIVPADLNLRLNRLKSTSSRSRNNKKKLNKKLNLAAIINLSLELLFQYGIIIFFVYNINVENITLASISELTACLAILMTALKKIGSLAKVFNDNADMIFEMDKEKPDLQHIIEVYQYEEEKIANATELEKLSLKPFTIKYLKKDNNHKPFELSSPNNIEINLGEVAVFTGVSGSGKSTVIKLLCDKIRIGDDVDVPSTCRALIYDDTLHFGSLSIYDEFFADTDVDLDKAYSILSNLHLLTELKINDVNALEKWMKKNYYSHSISHGQKQRLVLAKLLYHLNDDIDMLLLDEVTSGLDVKNRKDEGMDANRMLEYCIRYANSDKKRIVIVATHQSISECQSHLESSGYIFKRFNFAKGTILEV